MSIFDQIDEETQAAVYDEPRPGLWSGQKNKQGTVVSDDRPLDQYQTDSLIVTELMFSLPLHDGLAMLELEQLGGPPRGFEMACKPRNQADPVFVVRAYCQRSGIHSDPVLRLLAWRTWGDRDHRWFEPTAVLCRAAGLDAVDYTFDGDKTVFSVVFDGRRRRVRVRGEFSRSNVFDVFFALRVGEPRDERERLKLQDVVDQLVWKINSERPA